MRKTLVAAFALAMLAVMAFGTVGSAAWFSDSDHVAVTATSGNIDVQAHPTSFTVSNLMPGVWSGPYEFEVYNTALSTVPVKYRVTDEFVSESQTGFYNKIRVRVNQIYCGGSEITPSIQEAALTSLSFTNTQNPGPFAGGLPINYTACYNVYFELASNTTNAYENQTANFNLHVDATQVENPGW